MTVQKECEVISFEGNICSKEKLATAAALKSIRSLRVSGIDGILPLGDLISRCRDPHHQIGEYEERTLKKYNLMQPDGSISGTVRSAVLAGTSGGKFFD